MRFFPFLKCTKNELALLCGIFLLAICVRFLSIKDDAIFFFFDQSRDATVAYQITHGKPIKVQGPSASGTGDSVYHGVLYYYLLAPAYLLGNGSPYVASLWLGIVTSLTIFPVFFVAKEMSKSSKAGFLAAFLFAISFEAAQMGTWLSNPGFAVLTLTCFYYFAWRILFHKKHAELPWLALFLGLSNQSVIYSAYLFLIVLMLYALNWKGKLGEKVTFSVKDILISGVVYVAAIGTMLVNQALLFKRGLFNPFSTAGSINGLGHMPLSELGKEIFGLFAKNIQYAYFPGSRQLSLLFFLGVIFLAWKYAKDATKFLIIWFLAPLALLLLIYRNGYHVTIGATPALYILLTLALMKIWSLKFGKYLVILVVVMLMGAQLKFGQTMRANHNQIAGLQVGTSLKDQKTLIDRTYELANGQPFSISSLTIPYGYNTTWAYLYHWYGLQKYGYVPTYVGGTQAGILGEEFMSEKSTAEKIHFAIKEPVEVVPQYFIDKFAGDQVNVAGPQTSTEKFGTLELQVHDQPTSLPITK